MTRPDPWPLDGDVRGLTLIEPWATLIALRVKWIETRSFKTNFRGPVLIHAGKKEPSLAALVDHEVCYMSTGWSIFNSKTRVWHDLSLGDVVAVADLVDCLPITHLRDDPEVEGDGITVDRDGSLQLWETEDYGYRDISDQVPYGHFEPGRFGWLLDQVRPLAVPVPARGMLGLWRPEKHVLDAVTAQL